MTLLVVSRGYATSQPTEKDTKLGDTPASAGDHILCNKSRTLPVGLRSIRGYDSCAEYRSLCRPAPRYRSDLQRDLSLPAAILRTEVEERNMRMIAVSGTLPI